MRSSGGVHRAQPGSSTEKWLQDYIDPEFKIDDNPTDIDTSSIKKIDPHGHVVAYLESFQISMYLNHENYFSTSISYVVRKPKLLVNSENDSFVGMYRQNVLAATILLTDPEYNEDSL